MIRRALPIAGLLIGCSTVALPSEPQACQSDEECGVGQVCAADQGICYPLAGFVPEAHLAFDIREPSLVAGQEYAFRVEVRGCDREANLNADANQYTVRKTDLFQVFDLAVRLGPDPDPGTIEYLPARLELSQPARLFGKRLSLSASHPLLDGNSEVQPSLFAWPKYYPTDPQPNSWRFGGAVLVEITPEEDRAPLFQMLVPTLVDANLPCTSPTDCCPLEAVEAVDPRCESGNLPPLCIAPFGSCDTGPNKHWSYAPVEYRAECDRRLDGQVVRVDDALTVVGALPQANVTVRHATAKNPEDRPAIAAWPGSWALPQLECDGDEDCIAGDQRCDDVSGRCVLALDGRRAAKTATSAEDGSFSTHVYTYCDPASVDPITRAFTMTASHASSPLPSITFDLAPEFEAIDPDVFIEDKLCVPDWGVAAPDLALEVTGQPMAIAGDAATRWVCCDTSCLPTTLEGQPPIAPQPPVACHVATSSGPPTMSTALLPPASASQWEAAGCLRFRVDDRGNVGYLNVTAKCTEGGCTFSGLARGTADAPRVYTLRVESPVGSVLASRLLAVTVDEDGTLRASGTPIQMLTLGPRPLLRGKVSLSEEVCDAANEGEDGDCGAPNATVVAERLRMPGESTDAVPGPYLHTATVFQDPVSRSQGQYVLPLDPGVYVVTAVPAIRAPGGPAEVRVVDMRAGGRTENFELEAGILVTVRLTGGFDPRSTVLPIDIGSWKNLEHPIGGSTLDLNEPETCLSPPTEFERGCRIRSLIPAGSRLLLSAAGTVQVAARHASANGASCQD